MQFWRRGDPFIWLTGGALALCLAMIAGLVGIIVYHGAGVFWPQDLTLLHLKDRPPTLGKLVDRQPIPATAGHYRVQLKVGNRDVYGQDFRWVDEDAIAKRATPAEAVVFERVEWGDMHGFIAALYEKERLLVKGEGVWAALQELMEQADELGERIHAIERGELDELNRAIDDLHRQRDKSDAQQAASQALWAEHEALSERLDELRAQRGRWEVEVVLAGGERSRVAVAAIIRAYRPNSLSTAAKVQIYLSKGWEFVAGEPRESNTEGGIFPALFGTVMMVMLMSLAAVPFGILAALYLREYARQGFLVRLVRIAVNNLAGVPSIVFGMFGLGFFVYGIGGSIDQLFYADALPTPTYGTGGILWASLTLALLTVPVVIVATEEGLAAVPREMREGALALGATKFQMIWSVVLPSALPGILTGVILATARGAGEVAPLMITGVVKLAPDLPLDAFAPFFHLERKFMHLGFHIYDVGFQSPNVEAARPMVYTTALLLLAIVLLLNLTAIVVRNKLRRKYATAAF